MAWTIPLSLGDSYRGFRVLGTTHDYFAHYRFAGARQLAFTAGRPFADLYDAVLGADVARQLGLGPGAPLVIAHGVGNVSFANHDDQPFRVAGILQRTGTPVDRTVHVGLEAITAIHVDWQGGTPAPRGARPGPDAVRQRDLTPDPITAFMIGMRSKVMTFTMQRAINEYRQEPLLAIIPGVALSQLWNLVGIADTALMIVAGFVVLAGLLGMLTAILTSLNERRREMAILRSVGAQPRHVFTLLIAEAGTLAACRRARRGRPHLRRGHRGAAAARVALRNLSGDRWSDRLRFRPAGRHRRRRLPDGCPARLARVPQHAQRRADHPRVTNPDRSDWTEPTGLNRLD